MVRCVITDSTLLGGALLMPQNIPHLMENIPHLMYQGIPLLTENIPLLMYQDIPLMVKLLTICLIEDHICLMPENTLPLMPENTLPLMAEYLISLKFCFLARRKSRPLTTENTVLIILLIVNTFVQLVYLLSVRRHGRNRIRALESIDPIVSRQKPRRIRLVPAREGSMAKARAQNHLDS